MKWKGLTEEHITAVLREQEAGARASDLAFTKGFGEATRYNQRQVAPTAKRAAVAHLEAVMSLSEGQACTSGWADRRMIRYPSSLPPETALHGWLLDLAKVFGYRRLFILLRREGEPSGISIGSTARKDWRFTSAGYGSQQWAR